MAVKGSMKNSSDGTVLGLHWSDGHMKHTCDNMSLNKIDTEGRERSDCKTGDIWIRLSHRQFLVCDVL